jgi:hypothetical protein
MVSLKPTTPQPATVRYSFVIYTTHIYSGPEKHNWGYSFKVPDVKEEDLDFDMPDIAWSQLDTYWENWSDRGLNIRKNGINVPFMAIRETDMIAWSLRNSAFPMSVWERLVNLERYHPEEFAPFLEDYWKTFLSAGDHLAVIAKFTTWEN